MPHTIEETRDGRLLLVKLGPLGPVSNNAYIVADSATNDAIIVDAPAESTYVIPQTSGLNELRIIVTHRHRDNWGGNDELHEGIDVTVYKHEHYR
jgi:glyoxylase-like metal-dependent hydrolase (beta-lactamase superfamily II)